ncbi:hypothetical protein J1N35_034651 [Gossypium stocksii]|uniref:Uncharacterized protein n=1 Tax=Gossypium stocksii TaxID=47602 RepID=A0A9D3ZPF0_9ROSI|nr:hypothetical protein J1N35_034651 [Gossypium stocksii]
MVKTRGGSHSGYGNHNRRDGEGARRLNNIESGFVLSLHESEAGLHLPLYAFFYHHLQEYGIALRQLFGFS